MVASGCSDLYHDLQETPLYVCNHSWLPPTLCVCTSSLAMPGLASAASQLMLDSWFGKPTNWFLFICLLLAHTRWGWWCTVWHPRHIPVPKGADPAQYCLNAPCDCGEIVPCKCLQCRAAGVHRASSSQLCGLSPCSAIVMVCHNPHTTNCLCTSHTHACTPYRRRVHLRPSQHKSPQGTNENCRLDAVLLTSVSLHSPRFASLVRKLIYWRAPPALSSPPPPPPSLLFPPAT